VPSRRNMKRWYGWMLLAGVAILGAVNPARADGEFAAFLAGLWPEARSAGVPKPVFDSAIAGLTPDLSLPDLILPGRTAAPERGQAEFTQPATNYLNAASLANLAAEGRELLAKHKTTLERIEREIGVDRYALLAIWGRETDFGREKTPYDAIRVLATEAYLGKRKEMFRVELIAALKMLAVGVPRADLKSSWAGAVGLTQFMPTEYFVHGTDFDGDGKIDLAHSVPDALASAARQLKDKGWVLGQPWGYEVIVPLSSSCANEGPPGARKLAQWLADGFKRPGGKLFRPADLDVDAYLMSPAGAYGPAFLALENFQVLRRYNTSDLYALYVGNLADRIAGGGNFETPWAPVAQPATKLVADLQTRLKSLGFPMDKIDGKIGSNTRRQIGIFENQHGLKIDCWPSPHVLESALAAPTPAAQ